MKMPNFNLKLCVHLLLYKVYHSTCVAFCTKADTRRESQEEGVLQQQEDAMEDQVAQPHRCKNLAWCEQQQTQSQCVEHTIDINPHCNSNGKHTPRHLVDKILDNSGHAVTILQPTLISIHNIGSMLLYMWQSQVEIEHYSIAQFDRVTTFEVLQCKTSVKGGARMCAVKMRMTLALNGSYALQCFEHGNVVEVCKE